MVTWIQESLCTTTSNNHRRVAEIWSYESGSSTKTNFHCRHHHHHQSLFFFSISLSLSIRFYFLSCSLSLYLFLFSFLLSLSLYLSLNFFFSLSLSLSLHLSCRLSRSLMFMIWSFFVVFLGLKFQFRSAQGAMMSRLHLLIVTIWSAILRPFSLNLANTPMW